LYLRMDLIEGEGLAGKALLDLNRYEDARPHLEYASHWGYSESTLLLEKLYDAGKTQSLEKLAARQSMKVFTYNADFGGVKAPFRVYVREWPVDYPFLGIDDQVRWLKEARGGTFPAGLADAFRNLNTMARETNVSFPDLCASVAKR